MGNFVLVHGAWHGGWCWRRVATRLESSGHSVYAPTLTGLGERSHLAEHIDPASLNLDLHVQDVVRLLEFEGLEDVVLAGHAYAGMVISGVAEACPQRLAHLVYVNGVVPRDGEAMVDQLEQVRGPQFAAWVRGHMERGDGFIPPPSTAEEIGRRWGISDKEDLEWVLARVAPQPVAAFAQPVRLGRPEAASIRRTFVGTSESGFDAVASRAEEAGWQVFYIDTGHDPMITTPEELSDVLLQIGGAA